MTVEKAVVTLSHASLLPEMEVQNTFWFRGMPTTGDTGYVAVKAALDAFYRTAPDVGLDAVGAWISAEMTRSVPPKVEIYRPAISTGKIVYGAPRYTANFSGNLPAAKSSLNSLPPEVACCLSFKAEFGTEPESIPLGAEGPEGDVHPRARRRGRIYLGPLTLDANSTSSGQSRPIVAIRNGLTAAALDLMNDASLAALGIDWAVFSPTDAIQLGSIDTGARAVSGAWVDDSWDTQRRRGVKSSTRTFVGSPT